MGLSVHDFSILTPSEFDAIYTEWRSGKDAEVQGEWARCRWICYHILKPYAAKTLRVTDVLKFEWDKTPAKGTGKMTKKQRTAENKKFKELLELWKDDE